AHAHGLFRKKIMVGPAWYRLDHRTPRAVLLHEVEHCHGHHMEKRLAMIAALLIPPLVMLPWPMLATFAAMLAIYACWEWEGKRQEKEADAFAVSQGYGLEIARFLKANHAAMPPTFYPDYEARMANIERLIKQRERGEKK